MENFDYRRLYEDRFIKELAIFIFKRYGISENIFLRIMVFKKEDSICRRPGLRETYIQAQLKKSSTDIDEEALNRAVAKFYEVSSGIRIEII